MNRIAVENFLASIDTSMPEQFHIANAIQDWKAYGWDTATLNAIIIGIGEKYERR